jgi:cytochrome P450 family 144
MAATTADPLFDATVLEHPHPYYAQLRGSDPVHLIQGTDAYLVSRFDLIQEVVAAPDIYSSNSGEFLYLSESDQPGLRSPGYTDDGDIEMPGVLATADPPDHGRQRRILSTLLSVSAINERQDELRELIGAALDAHLGRGRVEWMTDIAEPLPMVIVARLLGLPDSAAPALKEQGYASVEQISGFVPAERREVLLQKMMELGPVIEGYAAARSSEHPDRSTVIGACAKAVGDGELSDMEAFGILGILLAAGGESTTSLLGTGVRILAERSDLQDRLRREPGLIPTFVEEVCRLEPPFRGHYRRVLVDTTLGGVEIPAGSRLVLLWPAANRDRALCPQPEEIDLGRTNPRHHVGFGWGIHLCIGAPLARLEARLVLEGLLARSSGFSIENTPEPLRHHQSLMVRRLVSLPLKIDR